MHRFYADPEKSGDNLFIMTPEDTFHALKVLRLRPGDHAEVILNRKATKWTGSSRKPWSLV